MKNFNLFLLWVCLLSVKVLSNNSSIAYELLYYYYVYKMEWESEPDSSRTIATGCVPDSGRSGMCYFDEFADYVMNDALFSDNYHPDPLTDHTSTPTADSVAAINNAIANGKINSARYDIAHLSEDLHGVTSMPDVLDYMLHAANDAINFGGVDQETMENAAQMSAAAKTSRGPDITAGQLAALKTQFPAIVQDYLAFNDVFDWDATFGAIDDAINSGDIGAVVGNAYKAALTGFSRTFGNPGYGYKVSDENHIAIQAGFTDTINQITQGVNDMIASKTPLASLSECSSDISSSSDSEKRKRMLVKNGSYTGLRKRAFAEIDSRSGLSGKRKRVLRLKMASEL